MDYKPAFRFKITTNHNESGNENDDLVFLERAAQVRLSVRTEKVTRNNHWPREARIMLHEVGQEGFVDGRYYSAECPEDMLQFSKAIGTPDDIAKKNCGASLLSFFRDYSVLGGWISSWKIGDPPIEYRTPFVIGKPFTRTKNEKSEQVVYDLKPIQPGDSVVSLVASYTGINHDLCYSFEYNFVEEGLIVTSRAKEVAVRRWFKRLSGMPPPE